MLPSWVAALLTVPERFLEELFRRLSVATPLSKGKDLSNVIAQIKNRNYRFIIYMDDLSFEEFEIEYKFLKAVIEGGCLLYTSRCV